jgi:hypothetical protein
MSNFKTGGPRQIRPGLAAMPLRAAQDPLDQCLQRAGNGVWAGMPGAHAQAFQSFAERRRIVFGVRNRPSGMAQLCVDGKPLCEIDGFGGFSQPAPTLLHNALLSPVDSASPAVLLSDSRLRQLLKEGDLLAMGGERAGVQMLQTLGVGNQILSLQARRESPDQWSLWQGSKPLTLCAAQAGPAFNAGDYELLLLAPLLDYGGPSYADTQVWNAAYRRSLGDSPEPVDPACSELAGRIEMILAALDDDAAGIAPLEQDIRPRPGGLAVDDFPAMLFLPHPVGDYPTQCPVADRGALFRLLYAVHDAGLALDIDPGWRQLGD